MLNKILKKVDYEVRKIPHVRIVAPGSLWPRAAPRKDVNVNWLESAYTIYLLKAFLLGLIDQPHGSGDGSLPQLYPSQEESAFFEAGPYEAWCEHNVVGLWIKYEDRDSYVFAFQDEADAAAFKMFI